MNTSANAPNSLVFSGIKFRDAKQSNASGEYRNIADVSVVINGSLVLTDIALIGNDTGKMKMIYPVRTNRLRETYKLFTVEKSKLSKQLFDAIIKAYYTGTSVEPIPTFPAIDVRLRKPPVRPGEKITPVWIATMKLDGLVVRDIRIIRNLDGTLRVSWPARRIGKSATKEIVRPLTPESRVHLDNAILERVKANDTAI